MKPAGQILPPLFVQKFRSMLPPRDAEAALRTFSTPKPPTFRVNTLKADPRFVRDSLREGGFKLENVPWLGSAFVLASGRQRDLEETDCYLKGEIYLQNLSSMVPPLLLSPGPGMRVLDLAAAPGSKTTQMACLMENRGEITACDNNPIRLARLRANLERQGASLAKAVEMDGALLGKGEPEGYDRVLLDAPCSAEGRFLAGEPSSFRYWKEDTNRSCAKLQRRLFQSAFLALKPGGLMVYSTCALSPEENEEILQWALEKYGGALRLEPASLDIPKARAALGGWNGKAFDPQVRLGLRILPTDRMEGFFAARILKTQSIQ